MQVIARRTLKEFWESHADAEQPLKAWYQEAKQATWGTAADIRTMYRSADFLPGNRVVFNIKGNTYRLVVRINYQSGTIFVRFVGTHAAYDKINAEEI